MIGHGPEQAVANDCDAAEEIVVFKQTIEGRLPVSWRIAGWDFVLHLRHAEGIEKSLNAVVEIASPRDGPARLLWAEERYVQPRNVGELLGGSR